VTTGGTLAWKRNGEIYYSYASIYRCGKRVLTSVKVFSKTISPLRVASKGIDIDLINVQKSLKSFIFDLWLAVLV